MGRADRMLIVILMGSAYSWWQARKAPAAPVAPLSSIEPSTTTAQQEQQEQTMLELEPEPEYLAADMAETNTAAFLRALRFAEGTAGPDGYRTLFGGALFDSFEDHPRIAKQFTSGGRKLWTSAAGAYQFMAVSRIPGGGSTKVDTWDRIKRKLGLQDFSPESQDRAALELIAEVGALQDVRAGRFTDAVYKVRKIWASMPGAGYSQPEKSIAALSGVYMQAGGAFA